VQQGNLSVIVIIILAGLNLIAWTAVFQLSRTNYLNVTFFDIGQGDSIFIETPQQNQILIDGGPSSAVIEKLGKEMPFWDRTIDLIILTHPERDHITGLLDVLRRYHVKNILWTGVIRDTPEYREWQRLLLEEQKEGAAVFISRKGQRITCLKCNFKQWNLEILYPFENVAGKELENSNNTSIVARLSLGQKIFLFTGDIEGSAERELILQGADIDSDILKVAHHGSKTSSIPEFISVVSPEVAVISVGKDNRYGHPHPKTLETLKQYGIKTLRTDEEGDIRIVSDGTRYKIE